MRNHLGLTIFSKHMKPLKMFLKTGEIESSLLCLCPCLQNNLKTLFISKGVFEFSLKTRTQVDFSFALFEERLKR